MNYSDTAQPQDLRLTALTSYIVERYHDDLRKRLPELIQLAHEADEVHLYEILTEFYQDLKGHMHIEETVFFPMINSGKMNFTSVPVDKLLKEEDACRIQLKEMRAFSNNYKIQKDASSTLIALYVGLEKLEQELEEHIHLEETILYPVAQKLLAC